MGSFSLRLALLQPQIHANDTRIIKQRRMAAPPAQLRSKAIQELPCITLTSRREAMLCVTTSLAATVLFPTHPAEAGVVNLDIRQNIIEKLEKLWEMAGLSKPKTESGSDSKEKKPPVNQNDQPMDVLEMLKEKAGISKPKSDSNSNGGEQELPGSQSNQAMDAFEMLKEKAGVLKPKPDSSPNGTGQKPPVTQNDQPKDMLERPKEKAGTTEGPSSN